MKIALDVSPIDDRSSSLHKFRGVGSYVRLLSENLSKIDTKNTYYFLSDRDLVPPDLDIFHIPYFDIFSGPVRTAPSGNRIVTVHDLIPIRFPKLFPAGLKGSVRWTLQKISLSKVENIITVSNASKIDTVKFGNIDPEKIHVVHLAVGDSFQRLNPGDWQKRIKEKYQLPDEYILYVGDATANKNLPRIIEAVSKLKIPLVLAGKVFTNSSFDRGNPWNHDLVTFFEKTRDNSLFVKPGFVPEEDLVGLYNLAKVFVMPSLYEGFGIPVLEAMSCGCPVVTSKEGGLFEVGGNGVLYADPISSDDISEKIHEIWTNIALSKDLSDRGLKQSKKFSIESTITNTVKVYEKVIKDQKQ